MLANILTTMRNLLKVELCYQLFITPLPLTLEKEQKTYAQRACDFLHENRTQIIEGSQPRHHVIHHFSQPNNPEAKKVLITHGWMSRAAYMIKLIRVLHREGYEVYALDF